MRPQCRRHRHPVHRCLRSLYRHRRTIPAPASIAASATTTTASCGDASSNLQMGTERKWDSSKGHERKLGLFGPTTLHFIPVVPLPVAARNTLFEGTMQDRWERDSKNRAKLAKLHETWSRSPENRERLRERSREWYKAPENRERFRKRMRVTPRP